MPPLNIYYQQGPLDHPYENFRRACSHSNFDAICVSFAYLSESISDKEIFDTDVFDIFRLHYKYNEDFKCRTFGILIAVRKHLSAHVRSEWQTDGVECLWVTVPSRGCRSRLHVACGFFGYCKNIDPFTDTLTSLSKTHPHDKFVIVGRFPSFKGDRISEEHRQRGTKDEVITRLRSATSRAGLEQFNKIKDENGYLCNFVFSSVPVTVLRCPRPLNPEVHDWNLALHFDLDIGPSECCNAAIDATTECCNIVSSSQRDVNRKSASAGGNTRKITDELTEENFERTVKELKAVRKKCSRVSKENALLYSECEALRGRIARLEGCSKLLVSIVERLKKLEERALAHSKGGFGQPATPRSTSVFGMNTGFRSTQSTGIFGGNTTHPTQSFGAMSSETKTFEFGTKVTQAPGTGLFGVKPAMTSFGLPQTTSSGSAFGALGRSNTTPVQHSTGVFSAKLGTTSGTPGFETTTTAFGTGKGGFKTSVSSSSNLFGGNTCVTATPSFGFRNTQQQTGGLGRFKSTGTQTDLKCSTAADETPRQIGVSTAPGVGFFGTSRISDECMSALGTSLGQQRFGFRQSNEGNAITKPFTQSSSQNVLDAKPSGGDTSTLANHSKDDPLPTTKITIGETIKSLTCKTVAPAISTPQVSVIISSEPRANQPSAAVTNLTFTSNMKIHLAIDPASYETSSGVTASTITTKIMNKSSVPSANEGTSFSNSTSLDQRPDSEESFKPYQEDVELRRLKEWDIMYEAILKKFPLSDYETLKTNQPENTEHLNEKKNKTKNVSWSDDSSSRGDTKKNFK